MRVEDITMEAIYEPAQPLEDDVYAYIRFWAEPEVGFSVLEQAVEDPDFSQCGLFWMKKEDFAGFFRKSDAGTWESRAA